MLVKHISLTISKGQTIPNGECPVAKTTTKPAAKYLLCVNISASASIKYILMSTTSPEYIHLIIDATRRPFRFCKGVTWASPGSLANSWQHIYALNKREQN